MARPFLAAVGLVFVAHSYAWAQNPVQIATKSELPGQWKKFEGSSVSLASYIGSGSFYTGYGSNSYASLALFGLPNYDLGTRYKLALRARIILEEELTAPDNPTGRRFAAYDPWLWLAADDLRTFERSKIRIGGGAHHRGRWHREHARLHLRRDGHLLPADSAVNPSIFPAKGRFVPCKSRCAS